MATGAITSAGLGSGIDVETLVSKLMTLERQPITQIQTQETSINTRLSAYGTLKSTLSTLQDAAKAMQTSDNFAAWTATVADSSIASASVSSGASAGSHSLVVTDLAQSQIVASTGYASSSAAVATGTLTLQLGTYAAGVFTGSTSTDITIDSSNNTLGGLRDAINAAKTGVTASIVNDGNTTRLVLSSDNSGTANSFKLSGLTGFDFNPAAAGASTLASKQVAKNAAFTLDGIDMTRSSNTVSDVLTGVTFTLKAKTTSTTSLAITSDTTSIKAKINSFVSAYNGAVSLMSSQTNYNTTTKSGGPLNGESSVRAIQSQLRNIIGGSVSGNSGATRLADVGIKVGVDGKLTVDDTKLSAALGDPTKNVAGLFTKSGNVSGLADQMATTVGKILGTDGTLTARTDGLTKTIASMNDRIAKLETRMTSIEARYRRQFNAMDSVVAGLNTTSTFLTQQLAKL